MTLLEEARTKLRQLAAIHNWDETEKIHIVSARDLTPTEAIDPGPKRLSSP